MRIPRAQLAHNRVLVAAALVLSSLSLWGVRHVFNTIAIVKGAERPFGLIFTLAFALLWWQALLCFGEPVYRSNPVEQQALDRLNLAVVIPVYNEDPATLHANLGAMLEQSRLPNTIVVVDDGSDENLVDYDDVRHWFTDQTERTGVAGRWVRQPNAGKRSAIVSACRLSIGADIIMTVDSDSILDREAISEGLKPFIDRRVQSVAGVILPLNSKRAWFRGTRYGGASANLPSPKRMWTDLVCRMTDVWLVSSQLINRSALSTVGGVLVNSGPIAFYRASVIRDNADGYLYERFLGRHVQFSDDSMLTLYAHLRGRTVQQPTSFAFTLMPETFEGHRRQFLRWMRGSFIRSFWRFRYLPLTRYTYWAHLISWFQFCLGTVVFIAFFVVDPLLNDALLSAWPSLFVVPVIIGYGQGIRYLGVRRSDQSLLSQCVTFLLSPLMAVYSFTILRALRIWAMLTATSVGWGTRQRVEVRLHGPMELASSVRPASSLVSVPDPEEPEGARNRRQTERDIM